MLLSVEVAYQARPGCCASQSSLIVITWGSLSGLADALDYGAEMLITAYDLQA